MKIRNTLSMIFIFTILVISTGCDTELGHTEDHDHDQDGIQDHAPEEHMDEDDMMHEEEHVPEDNMIYDAD